MKYFLLTLFLTAAFIVQAQVEVKDQPGNDYYHLIKKMCTGQMPTQNILIGMKAVPAAPAAFMDTLKKYDWVEIGQYAYHDKMYEDKFSPGMFMNEARSQYQFNIFRIMADGTKAVFGLNKFQEQEAKLTTTSFDKNTCEVYERLKSTATAAFIQDKVYGEVSYIKIISYKNGVLVLDINKTGKITDNKTMFRLVYKAIPQKFSFGF